VFTTGDNDCHTVGKNNWSSDLSKEGLD
jgi:hypothetical protein